MLMNNIDNFHNALKTDKDNYYLPKSNKNNYYSSYLNRPLKYHKYI